MSITVTAKMNPMTGYQSAASFEYDDDVLEQACKFVAVIRMSDTWFKDRSSNELLLGLLQNKIKAAIAERHHSRQLAPGITWNVSYRKGSWIFIFGGVGAVAKFLKEYPEIRTGAIALFNDICSLTKKAFYAAYVAAKLAKKALDAARAAAGRAKKTTSGTAATEKIAQKLETKKAPAPSQQQSTADEANEPKYLTATTKFSPP